MIASSLANGARRLALAIQLALCGMLAAHVPASAADPIQTQDTNNANVVAELMECKRQEGTLTIRIRFRNTGDKAERVDVISGRNYDSYYLTASNKKYFVLRDSEKAPLAVASDGGGFVTARIDKGGAYTFWAKYPAPPADIKKVSLYTPLTPPFDNVPISD
jgi:hypothetical protein